MDLERARRLGFTVREDPVLTGDRVVTEMTIEYFSTPGHHTDLVAADGSRVPRGVLIDELRQRFGGNRGTLRDPLGTEREIILDSAMPDGTYVSIGFKVEPREHVERRRGH